MPSAGFFHTVGHAKCPLLASVTLSDVVYALCWLLSQLSVAAAAICHAVMGYNLYTLHAQRKRRSSPPEVPPRTSARSGTW